MQAAFWRGQGLTHEEVAKRLDVRNVGGLVTVLKAHGVRGVGSPGMWEVRLQLSNARHADAVAMTRQAGYDLERGLSEFVGLAAKDRTIRTTLERARR